MATGPGNPLNITGTGAISFNGTVFHGGTLPVIYGGTGNTTFTAYSVIAAGTTATNPFQNVSGLGTAGQVLTSNGLGTLPTWQGSTAGITTIASQTFTSNGTYTPTTNMAFCIIEIVGGGAGGAGCAGNSAGQNSGGGGGGAGGYCYKIFSATDIGASQSVSIGAPGSGGLAGGFNGGNGGTTTFGAFLTAQGGTGGIGGPNTATESLYSGGAGGSGTGGTININGGFGGWGVAIGGAPNFAIGGYGASSMFGAGGSMVTQNSNGNAAIGYGCGGGGASGTGTSGGNLSGGVGIAGFCKIVEYIT